MRMLGVSVLTATLIAGAGVAHAKPKAKKAAKAEAAPADNPANGEEIGKLKGEYKWGLSPEDVVAIAKKNIDDKYAERLKKAAADPGKQDRIRGEIRQELNEVKKSFIKFEGNKTGWDVSIVDQEFGHGSGEAMLVTKDEQWTRYFFFFENGLYKMYLAFDKDRLKGKTFEQFGDDMQKKFGKARMVQREEQVKAGSKKKVNDYLIWQSMNSDSLKLVDRSGFYGVYCLVIYDGSTADRVAERRKVVAPSGDTKDSLVDAVTAKDDSGRDANDNVIDRITGKDIKKPGDEAPHQDIVVPRNYHVPTPKEINESNAASKDDKKKGKKDEKKAKGLEGIEL